MSAMNGGKEVPNTVSPFDSSAVNSVRQRPLREDLDHPPTALDALNMNKTVGKIELTLELVKHVSMRACFRSAHVSVGRGERA